MSVSRLRTRSYEIFVRCVRPISSYYIQTTNKTRMLNIDVKGGKEGNMKEGVEAHRLSSFMHIST